MCCLLADKVQSGPSLGSKDLGDSIKSGLKDVQKKATDAVSSVPTPAVGDLADLNADVRGASKNYRDPAGAVQQDKFAGEIGCPDGQVWYNVTLLRR